MEKIGLVTITYNSADVIRGFLESTLSQTFQNFVIYIIDNNSQEEVKTRLLQKLLYMLSIKDLYRYMSDRYLPGTMGTTRNNTYEKDIALDIS